MKEEEVESLLKEALIKKYGDKCSKCGKEGNLNICQILGQANSEYQYFLHCTRLTGYDMDYPYYLYNYYLNNFDAESEFLGLICNIYVIISPQYPTYEEHLQLISQVTDPLTHLKDNPKCRFREVLV